MSWLEQIDDVLQRYTGGPGGTQNNPSADFAKVAEHAPPQVIAAGLTQAFRSAETPPFAHMISNLFNSSAPQQRAGILNQLVGAAGPAAAGILTRFTGQGPTAPASEAQAAPVALTPQQAQQVDPAAVRELADRAQENDPTIVERASDFYAQHPQLVQGLGAAALALIVSHVSKRR